MGKVIKTVRMLCPNCDYEGQFKYIDDIVCPECKAAYMLPQRPVKETPGRYEDDKFMRNISPEKPVMDVFKKLQFNCPTCRRPNVVRPDPRAGNVRTCICQHCGQFVKVRQGEAIRQK